MPILDLADARIHYEIQGSGEAVLLIPGLGQTYRSWDPIVAPLAEHFSVIQIDNRGIGQSAARKSAGSMDAYSSDFVELFDALQIDRAHVIGISFGGVLAQRFAADHPNRVDRLVLISTTSRTHPYLQNIAALLAHAIRKFPLEMFYRTVEILGNSPQYFDANETEIMAAIPHNLPDRRTRRVVGAQLKCLATTACATDGRTITAPTLVVAGEFDAMIPNCYGRELAAELPNSRFVMIEGCGHNPVSERPNQIAGLLSEFLTDSEISTPIGAGIVAN